MKKPITANPWDYKCPEVSEFPNNDEILTETAGFVPLEVRFRQMQDAGIRARFAESEFDSADLVEIYLNHPEFELTLGDELEDVQHKINLRNNFIKDVLRAKLAEQANVKDDAPSEEKASVNKANDEQGGSSDV